jgi:cyclopropane fatty-acyl-phospholipid synthase-like methyltransferase
MSDEILSQRSYWNREADVFQRIYTHQKSTTANLLDRIFRKDMYERYLFTLEHCEPVKGRTFLDVGCGNGLYSLELARRGAAKVTGLDIAENMIQLCWEARAREGLEDRCVFEHTDLLKYDAKETFDVSFGIGLFDYIRDPVPVLSKMRELTTDKSILAFPRFWTWRAPVRKARLATRGCDVFFYRRSAIENMLAQAGYESCDFTTVGKLHCVVASVGAARPRSMVAQA